MLSDKTKVIKRLDKGGPLTYTEMDVNLTELKNVIDDTARVDNFVGGITGFVTSEADRASQAADAAQLAAKVYTTVDAGLAATAVNGYFSVVATDNKEFLILYKNNSGVELEVKRYPSALIVGATRLTSGDVFGTINTFGQALNGGVMVLGSDGRTIGAANNCNGVSCSYESYQKRCS